MKPTNVQDYTQGNTENNLEGVYDRWGNISIQRFAVSNRIISKETNWAPQPPHKNSTTYGSTRSNVTSQPWQATKGQSLILILTYLRSGSTLTADIIQKGLNVFYVYEPLRYYLQEGFAYFDKHGVCYANDTCRNATEELSKPFTILEDIHNYFMCGFYFVHPRFFWNSAASKSVEALKKCFAKENIGCLTKAWKTCNKGARSVKTIRMTMDLAEVLMEKIPNLKIVHLMRDPRGVMQSRKRGGFLENGKLMLQAKSFCSRMLSDIDVGRKIRQAYPNRLKTVLYDQIADFPKEASHNLFKFLNLKPAEDFDKWLYEHTAAGKTSGFYQTTRANSSTTASSWRLKWSFDEVKIIDKQCKKLYKVLGLKPATEINLRNLDVKLRAFSPEFGDLL